ncbi:MAG: DUF4976 domain-containing protein [Bryobacteraceae bacterium]
MNVYPTLADLAGLPAPQQLDGVSLRPLLKDPQAPWDRPAINTFLKGNHGIYTERYHYIRYHDGSEELYDRRQDPNEWVNLASRPEMAQLKRDMQKWLPQNAPDSPRANTLKFDPATVTWTPKK